MSSHIADCALLNWQYMSGSNKIEVVKVLVGGGADLDARDEKGETALMLAVEKASSNAHGCHRSHATSLHLGGWVVRA